MADKAKREPVARGWLRVKWSAEKGVELAFGDCQGLLGISARRLVRSPEPLSLLPPEVSTILSGGLPEIPVRIATSSLSGSVTRVNEHAEIILFAVPGLQSRSNLMLDELAAGVVGTDRSGTVNLWNRSMSTIFRIPQKHVLGKKIQDVLVAPVLYSWENVIQMVLDGKQIKVVCRPDQQRRVECRFSLGGNGVVGTCFDTTESFQAENRLRTSRKMNQAYFHSVSTGLVLFDKDYRILVANRAFGRMFGLVENLLGIHLHEILPSESYEIIEDQTRPFFTSDSHDREEVRTAHFILPDKTRRVILQDVRPITEDSGEIFYAVGIFEDISEITILRENYSEFRSAVRSIDDFSRFLRPARSPGMDDICQRICDCMSADGVAVYLTDPMSENRIEGASSRWPGAAPEIFSDLRLSPVHSDSDSGYRLTNAETGALKPWYETCYVVPLETDRKSFGNIIIAYSGKDPEIELFPIARIAAMLISGYLQSKDYENEIEHLELLITRFNKLIVSAVNALDVPVGMFRMDWSVVLWNASMESLTGVSKDLATGRSEVAANILFGGIGGISEAQRLFRNGSTEFPESWEVEDQQGNTTRCMWRLVRSEYVEGRNLEPVVIVAGVQSDDRFSVETARKAAETYSALSRGTSALLSASDRTRIQEAATASLLEVTEASRVTLKIRGTEPVTRASYDQRQTQSDTRKWTLPVETETELIGECVFYGGKDYPTMRDFIRNVARTCLELEKSAIGRRFAFLAERAAGKFFITNSSGRILLSTWMDATEGAVSNRTIYDLFSGTDLNAIDGMISGVLKKGRLDMELKTGQGKEMQMAAVALDGHQAESLLIWWPVTDPLYSRELREKRLAARSSSALQNLIDGLLDSISSGFKRVREVLNPDHPVAS
ncbi:MAG: PAS domain-containing protein, partial [Candidatus Aegiribacteria sp.]|nr:PAS domain-containing protein [Candidatus Aegiribacteria sp.]MBD3294054.1 PAS domain-containing protein [Candidatus Fermentibacteria bacterium]